MFSGKTEELLRRLRRAEYAKQKVVTIKHHIDTRQGFTCIATHTGQKRTAIPTSGNIESISYILQEADNASVIGIDEVQFFPKEIVSIICQLIAQKKRVIASGLDLDFRGEPFGIMPSLLAIADTITKLKAICVQCGKDAYHSQRLIDGKPAQYHDPIIKIGAQECYEARCRSCFSIDRPPVIPTVMNRQTYG